MNQMTDNVCRDCRFFNGFDGIGELWTLCSNGDFKGTRTHCEYFEKKVTKADLLRKVNKLEKELEELQKELADNERKTT